MFQYQRIICCFAYGFVVYVWILCVCVCVCVCVFVCVCVCVCECVCMFLSLTRVQSMCRNVNVSFLCCPCRQPSVTVHIHEAAFLEHVNFYQERTAIKK